MTFNMYISGPKMIMHEKTLAEMFMIQLNDNKGLFGIDCSTGTEYSYPKLKKDVSAMATVFQRQNIGHGDVVMTTDYGSYEGQVVILAGLLVGATLSALDFNLRKSYLTAIIKESKPDVLFCNSLSVKKIADIFNTISRQPTLKISTVAFDNFTVYSSVISTAADLLLHKTKQIHKNRPCALVYSSGTTGVPKGIYLSDNAIKCALISLMPSLMNDSIENTFMTTSPIFWYSGVMFLLLGTQFGKPRSFFSTKPTAEQILSAIHNTKPKFLMTGVSEAYDMMSYQMANGNKFSVESLITYKVGGSPMRADLQNRITKNLLRGRIPLKQTYGATEQGLVTTWPMQYDINSVIEGSVGRPAAGIKIKVVHLKTGECLGPNTEGEIRIKSVSNMIGYACDMKKTIDAYDDNGWFKSGDVGYYTDHGCLFIVGRIKEMLIYKDRKISPVDIETVLLSHPAVLDAGVTSKGYSLHGDLLVGVVKIKSGHDIEPDRLLSYVHDKVEDHEKLRGGLKFVEDLPRSPAGKLNREQLKKMIV